MKVGDWVRYPSSQKGGTVARVVEVTPDGTRVYVRPVIYDQQWLAGRAWSLGMSLAEAMKLTDRERAIEEAKLAMGVNDE